MRNLFGIVKRFYFPSIDNKDDLIEQYDRHLAINNEIYNIYDNSEALLDILVRNMISAIENPIDRIIFIVSMLNGMKKQRLAKILKIHPTNISRRVKRIQKKLLPFAKGYTITVPDVKYHHKNKHH